MKSDYVSRALKFANILAILFANCYRCEDFEEAVASYNATHSRPLSCAHGVSRFVVMRADYVIKFDMPTPKSGFENGRAGNNQSEYYAYQTAVRCGMGHLLAESTLVTVGKFTVNIMPRIGGVSDDMRYWTDYCTDEEEDWLFDNICDLHYGNVGYRNGKVCVVDYAWVG